ncbi:glycosyltransferase family 4 protein [Thalassotalea agariperforans]
MSKIAFVVASPETISSFLLAYLHGLAEQHQVHVICPLNYNEQGELQTIRGLNHNITVHNVTIHRDPKIFADIKSLFSLHRLFKEQAFDVVHSYTPKAGLLSQISAYFAGIKYRFHTFTGQVWATKTGLARFFLKSLDKITASLATYCLVDSPSQQRFLIAEKLLTKNNSRVLLKGSVSGVNLQRFSFSAQTRSKLRAEHGFSDNDFIFMFVGRLKVDKGVPELIAAFNQLTAESHHLLTAKLVIIGSDEENLAPLLTGNEHIHYLGFKANVHEYYSFADILSLPSHREGFGNVIIEAAACQLPAIASNIYGLSDAVQDGYSGYLHQVREQADIYRLMSQVLNNPEVIKQMRQDARVRVEQTFDEVLLVAAFLAFYQEFVIEVNQ